MLNELATGATRPVAATIGGANVFNSAWSRDSKEIVYWDATDGFLKRLVIETGGHIKWPSFATSAAWTGDQTASSSPISRMMAPAVPRSRWWRRAARCVRWGPRCGVRSSCRTG